MTPSARSLLFAAGVLLVGALPILGSRLRSTGDRCSFDGVRIDARYRARLVRPDGGSEDLCCVSCLVRAVACRDAAPRETLVADETTGALVEAATAWFVRSAVVTVPATRNRVHAFAREADARAHAASFHGTVLARPGLPSLRDLEGGTP